MMRLKIHYQSLRFDGIISSNKSMDEKGGEVVYNPQLETFLRVADAGSFNKAAEESYITPTAVIKQINLLEKSLGVKIFDRSHRGLTLTKAGRSIYIVPFENTPQNAREILANMGKHIDIIGGIFDETLLEIRGCAGLELVRGSFRCAVSMQHRLAVKDRLQITDLYGENLLLIHRGWSHKV